MFDVSNFDLVTGETCRRRALSRMMEKREVTSPGKTFQRDWNRLSLQGNVTNVAVVFASFQTEEGCDRMHR